MSFSKRLLMLTVVTVIAMLLIAVVSYVGMQRVYEDADYGNERTVPGLTALNKAQASFSALRIRIYRHIVYTDPNVLSDIEKSIDEAKLAAANALSTYAAFVEDPEDKRRFDAEQLALSEYIKNIDAVLAPSRAGDKAAARELLDNLAKQGAALQQAFEAHIDYDIEVGQRQARRADAEKKTTEIILIAVGILTIMVICATSLLMRKSLLSRIATANAIAARVADGDLTEFGSAGHGNDELLELIASMEKMRAALSDTVKGILSGSESLARSASELANAANDVSQGAEVQANSTSASAAALEQLTVSIDHVGGNAEEVRHQAQAAGDQAAASKSGIMQAADDVRNVAVSVEQAASQIEVLSNQVAEIDTISRVIKDVADQTNLLALNAAIEAARAGEHGRGFAVVADEVRKLAERTAGSVNEINDVVASIQGSTASAVEGMRANRRRIGAVVEIAQSASHSMHSVHGATESVSASVTSISDAMNEQRAAANELARNVEAIAQSSEENSVAVNSLAQTAESLVELSASLKTAVGQFRL